MAQRSFYSPLDTHKRSRQESSDVIDPSEWHQHHRITFAPSNSDKSQQHFEPVTPFTSFEQLSSRIPHWALSSLARQGFDTPTPIQSVAWPLLLDGRDMVGIAKTGSGKTLAFLIPSITFMMKDKTPQYSYSTTNQSRRGYCNRSSREPACPRALVLAPTRELALQTQAEAQKIFDVSSGVRAVCIYGGSPKGAQRFELRRGADLVTATPGRLLDMLSEQCIDLSKVEYLVLDEADRMLDMGFEPQVKEVCEALSSENRQTMLFSATWPREIQAIARQFMKDFVRIHIGSDELLANPDVTQHFIFTEQRHKIPELRTLLDHYRGKRVLVFTRTKKCCDDLERMLRGGATRVYALHGDKAQTAREWILRKLKESACVVIATDVAARGLDVKELEAVINFDFPEQVDDYVHRIGRTGRAGAKGNAHTILVPGREAALTHRALQTLKKVLREAEQNVPVELEHWRPAQGSKNRNRFAYGGSKGGFGTGKRTPRSFQTPKGLGSSEKPFGGFPSSTNSTHIRF